MRYTTEQICCRLPIVCNASVSVVVTYVSMLINNGMFMSAAEGFQPNHCICMPPSAEPALLLFALKCFVQYSELLGCVGLFLHSLPLSSITLVVYHAVSEVHFLFLCLFSFSLFLCLLLHCTLYLSRISCLIFFCFGGVSANHPAYSFDSMSLQSDACLHVVPCIVCLYSSCVSLYNLSVWSLCSFRGLVFSRCSLSLRS